MRHMPCPLPGRGLQGVSLLGGGAGSPSIGEDEMGDDLTKDGMKNQGEGLVDQAKGRVRNTVGGITGDSSEQLKGKAEELKGKAQRKIGEKQVDADN
jgi:uncharacterized protein YjbJ (UPF0337 family)